jgi:hypothetical protein
MTLTILRPAENRVIVTAEPVASALLSGRFSVERAIDDGLIFVAGQPGPPQSLATVLHHMLLPRLAQLTTTTISAYSHAAVLPKSMASAQAVDPKLDRCVIA